MLITTGKKPDVASRAIAKALASAIPGSQLENRGKRSLARLISNASKLKFSRLCAIYKEEGKPHAISFLSIGGKGEWSWLSPKIHITSAAFPHPPSKIQSYCLEFSGTKSKLMQNLILPANSSDEAESKITASQKKISISLRGKKIAELGVSYEKT